MFGWFCGTWLNARGVLIGGRSKKYDYTGGGLLIKHGGLYVLGGNFTNSSPLRYASDAALYCKQIDFLQDSCSFRNLKSEQKISGRALNRGSFFVWRGEEPGVILVK